MALPSSLSFQLCASFFSSSSSASLLSSRSTILRCDNIEDVFYRRSINRIKNTVFAFKNREKEAHTKKNCDISIHVETSTESPVLESNAALM